MDTLPPSLAKARKQVVSEDAWTRANSKLRELLYECLGKDGISRFVDIPDARQAEYMGRVERRFRQSSEYKALQRCVQQSADSWVSEAMLPRANQHSPAGPSQSPAMSLLPRLTTSVLSSVEQVLQSAPLDARVSTLGSLLRAQQHSHFQMTYASRYWMWSVLLHARCLHPAPFTPSRPPIGVTVGDVQTQLARDVGRVVDRVLQTAGLADDLDLLLAQLPLHDRNRLVPLLRQFVLALLQRQFERKPSKGKEDDRKEVSERVPAELGPYCLSLVVVFLFVRAHPLMGPPSLYGNAEAGYYTGKAPSAEAAEDTFLRLVKWAAHNNIQLQQSPWAPAADKQQTREQRDEHLLQEVLRHVATMSSSVHGDLEELMQHLHFADEPQWGRKYLAWWVGEAAERFCVGVLPLRAVLYVVDCCLLSPNHEEGLYPILGAVLLVNAPALTRALWSEHRRHKKRRKAAAHAKKGNRAKASASTEETRHMLVPMLQLGREDLISLLKSDNLVIPSAKELLSLDAAIPVADHSSPATVSGGKAEEVSPSAAPSGTDPPPAPPAPQAPQAPQASATDADDAGDADEKQGPQAFDQAAPRKLRAVKSALRHLLCVTRLVRLCRAAVASRAQTNEATLLQGSLLTFVAAGVAVQLRVPSLPVFFARHPLPAFIELVLSLEDNKKAVEQYQASSHPIALLKERLSVLLEAQVQPPPMPLDDVDADISADPMDDAVLTRAMQDVNQAIAANLSSAAAVADSAGAGDQRSRALDENPIANQAVVAMHQLRRVFDP